MMGPQETTERFQRSWSVPSQKDLAARAAGEKRTAERKAARAARAGRAGEGMWKWKRSPAEAREKEMKKPARAARGMD